MIPDMTAGASESVPFGPEEFALDPRDAAAIDALVESGFELTGLGDGHAARAARAASLLKRLEVDADAHSRQALIDATLARAARLKSGAVQRSADPVLCADDEEAVEALVTAGYRVERVPRVLRDRAARVARFLSMLDAAPAEPLQDVRSATMARIQAAIADEEARMVLEPAAAPGEGMRGGFRPRLADLISVAALLLIGGSVLLPMFGAMRQYAGRLSCAGEMQAAGTAFGQYSADHANSWAMASASAPGGTWWNFGEREKSNSANLFTIARTGYTTLDELACPGNQHAVRGRPGSDDWDWDGLEQISYAYQNLFARQRPDISGSTRVVIMSDKSPVVVLSRQHRKIDPFANSPNHEGRGQNLLYSDGRVEWRRSPVLEGGDNLWLPRPVEQMIRSALADPLEGHESPASADDVMAVP